MTELRIKMPNYSFKIFHKEIIGKDDGHKDRFFYEIYKGGTKVIKGNEYFEHKTRASFAAIGHISILENKVIS